MLSVPPWLAAEHDRDLQSIRNSASQSAIRNPSGLCFTAANDRFLDPAVDASARPALAADLRDDGRPSVVVAISTFIGAANVSWRSVVAGDETARAVLLRIRLPRVIVAALIGATLAVSGLAFQTLLRNPLADPFILGVSGGAACGAAISTALGRARVPGLVPIVAFASACGATAAVFFSLDATAAPTLRDCFCPGWC